VDTLSEAEKRAKKKVMSVKVSTTAHNKAVQLQKFLDYSSAKRAWGKDQKLLHCNLLLVPTSKNYTVLLAMGRRNKVTK
jgi:hypothetical protein